MAHTTATDQSLNSQATEAYKIVQRYDGGNRSSIEQDLRQLLGSDVVACDSYIRMLDEDDEHRRRIEGGAGLAEDQGGGRIDRAAGERQLPEQNPPDSREAGRSSRKEKSQLDHYLNGQRRRRRRHHRYTPSSSSSDSTSERDGDPKHQGPNSSLYAWATQPAVRPELDHRSILKQTMNARNNYTKGGKVGKTVRDLLEHGNLPNFPTSKWKTVLSDDYMDLQKVVGGVESAMGEVREVTVIGGLEIGHGREPPSKAIVSANDWATAFDLYRGAVLYAFPHRNEELLAYRDYINDAFRVFRPQHHPAVIEFDQRCRNLYSRTHARALSDISQFASEYSKLTVQVANAAAGSSLLTQPLASDPICFRYNYATCSGCSYRHVCLICEQPEHIADECPEKKLTVQVANAAAGSSLLTQPLASDPICFRYNYATCSGCSYRHVCLICEQPEHIADECPEKPGPSQPSSQHGKGRQSDNNNEFGVVGDGDSSN